MIIESTMFAVWLLAIISAAMLGRGQEEDCSASTFAYCDDLCHSELRSPIVVGITMLGDYADFRCLAQSGVKVRILVNYLFT